MRRLLFLSTTALVAVIASLGQAAPDSITLQLKWRPQAQFAGYYVARDKGFYQAAGLAVTIKPGGPDLDPGQVLAEGGADVMVDWMPAALAARERGVPVVNIAQVFQRSGLMLVCRKDAGIATPQDLSGHTVAGWVAGNGYRFHDWIDRLGYRSTGEGRVLRQAAGLEPLRRTQGVCISAMTYTEY